MRPRKTSISEGYTLMELVIVVAMVSLLLAALLVFIGTAQRNGRDAQRRDALAKTEIALEQYSATHSGTFLSGATVVSISALYSGSYLGTDVQAPGGSAYTDNGDGEVELGEMVVRDSTGGSAGSGYCVMTRLESGDGIYGATNINKSGHLISSPATCT